MPDPHIIAGVVGGKKLFGMGLAAMATISSEKIIDGLPLLLVVGIPLATAAFFVGTVSKDLQHLHENINQAHKSIYTYIDGEIARREIKLDFVYARATQGERFTASDGKRHNARISALEKTMKGHSRFLEEGKRLERRIGKCEEKLDNGSR